MSAKQQTLEVIGAWMDANIIHDESHFGADEGLAQALADDGLLAPETTTEYGFYITGHPTGVADWSEWSEDPLDDWLWLTDQEQRDQEGVDAEDQGYNVDYYTRQVPAPTPDPMEHMQ